MILFFSLFSDNKRIERQEERWCSTDDHLRHTHTHANKWIWQRKSCWRKVECVKRPKWMTVDDVKKIYRKNRIWKNEKSDDLVFKSTPLSPISSLYFIHFVSIYSFGLTLFPLFLTNKDQRQKEAVFGVPYVYGKAIYTQHKIASLKRQKVYV